MTTKTLAAEAFAARTATIQDQLAQLQALAARGFGFDGPVNYGHVGSAAHIQAELADLLDMLNHTGEYAA